MSDCQHLPLLTLRQIQPAKALGLAFTTFLAGLLCMATAPSLTAQEGETAAEPPALEITPEQITNILGNLENLEETRKAAQVENLRESTRAINEAMQDPRAARELYVECVRSSRFRGVDSSMNTPYREWREQNDEVLDHNGARRAMQYHLRYLALTLEWLAMDEEPTMAMAEKLQAYVRDLAAEQDELFLEMPRGGETRNIQQLLSGDLTRGIYVEQLELREELGKLNNWEMSPGYLSGIEDNGILPIVRVEAPHRLPDYWDNKIARETAANEDVELARTDKLFNTRTLPTLRYNRAKDIHEYVNRNEGLKQMLGVLEANPAHPSFNEWVNEVRDILERAATQDDGGAGEGEDAS